MKVSVILGHPYKGSFNAAIAYIVTETLESNGHTVMFHDLYNEKFNPSIPPKELVCDVSDDELVTFGKSSVRCPLKPSDSIPLCPNNPAH